MSKDRIKELETLIEHHQDLYYNDNPEISDAEFDSLWDELKKINPESSVLKKVGTDTKDGFEKAQHLMPMGSQEKAANPEEFLKWALKVKNTEYFVQYKLDGASLELQYENGVFVKAVTRGDGLVGDDITRNAQKMSGCIKNVSKGFSGGVRGEVIMTHSVHKEFFSTKANCRNAANGLMKRKDGSGAEKLTIICYDVASVNNKVSFKTEDEKLAWLESSGFSLVPNIICKSAEEVIQYRSKVMEERSTLDYDIDGLVIKSRNVDFDDSMRARPEKQIAFKFSLEEAVSVVREVEWSRSGASFTPVAIVDPVQLAGTQVKRASLANPNLVRSLNLKIGSHVVLTKRGEIIPKIEYLVSNPIDAKDIEYPSVCPSCNTSLTDEGTRLFCPNKKCPELILHRLLKWISVLDIRDFGQLLTERLFYSGRVKSIKDLYTLNVEELSQIERMGTLSATKILKNLKTKKTIPLSVFISGFDIEGIGELIAERFVQAGFTTIESIISAPQSDLANIHGVADITAKNMQEGLIDLKDEMISVLQEGFVEIVSVNTEGILKGKTFCITGELVRMKRTEAEQLIKSLSGQIKASVTKDLSFLVTNDKNSGSSKNKKAQELSIKIIDEDELFAMIEGHNENKD